MLCFYNSFFVIICYKKFIYVTWFFIAICSIDYYYQIGIKKIINIV